MKSYKLDFAALAKEKVAVDPEINIIGIEFINGGFALLTQAPNQKYFWSDIKSSYSIARVNNRREFDSSWEAISNALQDDEFNEIFEFESLREFCQWYISPVVTQGGIG